ncbi:MAG: hypothetical protein B6245_10660 [Desulfobacteraceae bacterium 4572_88]|nr:MAG: hypothetical protein B6245_10660 [Desulfobacteraceae bacterium 4572_88]
MCNVTRVWVLAEAWAAAAEAWEVAVAEAWAAVAGFPDTIPGQYAEKKSGALLPENRYAREYFPFSTDENRKEKMEKGEKVAALAIGLHLMLFGIKYVFSMLSGSIALKAEAFHSLSDLVASSTVFGGLLIARRKTKSFPYGLYKVENLVSVLLAVAILYAGYEIAVETMRHDTVELKNVWLTIASVLFVIGVTWGYSRYAVRIGREIHSPSLLADAQHVSVDMFASIAVLAGLLSSFVGFSLDRVAAFLIVGIVVWCGGKILIDGIRVLLDASLDYQTLSFAEKLILSDPQVVEIQNLMGRNSGRYKFIEADIVLKTHDLSKADFVTKRIEAKIREQVENVDRLLLHCKPLQKENLVYALPLTDDQGQCISSHFGEAPYFGLFIVRIADSKVTGQHTLSNPFTQVAQGKGILVAEFLNKQQVDVMITKESFEGKGPFYVFSDAGTELVVTEVDTTAKALVQLGIAM